VDGDEDRLAGLLRRCEGVRREGLGLGGECGRSKSGSRGNCGKQRTAS